jgi:hypothetical protein
MLGAPKPTFSEVERPEIPEAPVRAKGKERGEGKGSGMKGPEHRESREEQELAPKKAARYQEILPRR